MIIDMKSAENDIELVLSYLEYFHYLPKDNMENLRAYLKSRSGMGDSAVSALIEPKQSHIFGPLIVNNRGTRKVMVSVKVKEL